MALKFGCGRGTIIRMALLQLSAFSLLAALLAPNPLA